MSADDKEVTMARFKRGEIDVLIATTVIEVGVDVPNATPSWSSSTPSASASRNCTSCADASAAAPRKAICVLAHRREGFASKPNSGSTPWSAPRTASSSPSSTSQQRGPGEFFGTRQAGMPEFRVANLLRDRDLLELAKSEASAFAEGPDAAYTRVEIDAVWARLKQQWQRRYGLVEA